MNSLQVALAGAAQNVRQASKTSRREVRKPVAPEAKTTLPAPAAAPVVSTPKAKAVEVKPETIFTISDRAKLESSKYAARLTAYASDPKVHRDHTTFTLAAILSIKKPSFTLTDVIVALDRPGFEGAKPKSDKLLRAYVADCVSTLESFGISKQASK
jgi:hypothetical protein